MAESKTEKQKVQEITEKLEQGIKELFESEKIFPDICHTLLSSRSR